MPEASKDKPRVLIIHNRYRQPGGEDVVADAQAQLLTSRGHAVRRYEKHNLDINSFSLLRKARLFLETADNPQSAKEIAALAAEFKPDVAHVHNILPLISPSIYKPLNDAGVKVIQWLHNFRLVCPAGTLYRDNAPCSLCLTDHSFAPAIRHKCWSESKWATKALVRSLLRHRRKGTWRERIDLFVALNSYQKTVLVEHAGLPEEKVVVQPNFQSANALTNPGPTNDSGEFFFAGRLCTEKGVLTLLESLRTLPKVRFAIAGDGPLREQVQRACRGPNHLWLGAIPHAQLLERLKSARGFVFASEWAEGCPGVILEALSCGVPVVASSVAGAVELLNEGQTALFFPPGDADALSACVRQLAEDDELRATMSANALASYAEHYTADAGYRNLLRLYTRLGIA